VDGDAYISPTAMHYANSVNKESEHQTGDPTKCNRGWQYDWQDGRNRGQNQAQQNSWSL